MGRLLFLLIYLSFPLFGNPAVFQSIFQQHLATLAHLQQPNPPRLILFSATCGMGKTYTAKKLEEHFRAIRLSSDEARELFKKNGLELDQINDYLEYCLRELHALSPNRMIVLDRSCDRTFDSYISFAQKYGYETFLIRLLVPREIVEGRITSRGYDVQYFLRNLNKWWDDYERFGNSHVFDYYFDNSQNDFKVPSDLIQAIEKRMIFKKMDTKAADLTRLQIMEYADSGSAKENNAEFSEILPGLYVGTQKMANLLTDHSPSFITDMITCRTILEKPSATELNWKGFSISDSGDAEIFSIFEASFQCIEGTERAIFVHCNQGRSRSPTLIIAYLMRKFALPFQIAYKYVQKKHPNACPNIGFIQQLIHYEKVLESKKQ